MSFRPQNHENETTDNDIHGYSAVEEVKDLTQSCLLYAFLNAVQGNWRNAVYVECINSACQQKCSGFLLALESNGKAVLLPEKYIRVITGHVADKSECTMVITRKQFEAFSSIWLAWLTDSDNACPVTCYLQSCEHCEHSCLPD